MGTHRSLERSRRWNHGMDTSQLVAGGADGSRRIAELVRDAEIPVDGIYIIKSTTDEGSAFWNLRLITPVSSLKVIRKVVNLRHKGKLPWIDPEVRIKGVSSDNVEASRIMAYAKNAFE